MYLCNGPSGVLYTEIHTKALFLTLVAVSAVMTPDKSFIGVRVQQIEFLSVYWRTCKICETCQNRSAVYKT